MQRVARKLEEIGRAMDSMKTQNNPVDFLNDPENSQRLNGLVEDIRYAFMDYQVCAHKRSTLPISNIRLRLRYRETYTTRAVKRS